MAERQKVMTWLEICGKNNDCSGCCPYNENGFGEYGQCLGLLMADAYELLKEQEEQIKTRDESLEKAREEIRWLREMLKEQEAKNVIAEKRKTLIDDSYDEAMYCEDTFYHCPSCNRNLSRTHMNKDIHFCSSCGQAVKWDG